jgi:hypothetical protein
MEQAKLVISLIIAVCSLISVLIGLIPLVIKTIRTTKQLVKEGNWKLILGFIKDCVFEVEGSNKSNEEKFNDVLNKVKEYCNANNYECDVAKISSCINELIVEWNSWRNLEKQLKKD